jgi:hypothetical protein
MLYVFFWVIPRRLNFICRRFGTLCLFHLHRQVSKVAYEDGTECSETSAYKIQTPGNYPEENTHTVLDVIFICHSCKTENCGGEGGSVLMQRGAVTGRNTLAFTAAFALGYRKGFRKFVTFAENHHTKRSTD